MFLSKLGLYFPLISSNNNERFKYDILFTYTSENKMSDRITEQALGEMAPDERIQYLIDKSFPQYGRTIYRLRVRHAIDPVLRIIDPKAKDVVEKAFLARVEDNLNQPGEVFGGGPLDHLPQLGIGGITQETYERLNAKAAGLAGAIIRDAGFPGHAKKAFESAQQAYERYVLLGLSR